MIVHVARERVPVLNTEFWLLNTALAEPTKEVLQAPHTVTSKGNKPMSAVYDLCVSVSNALHPHIAKIALSLAATLLFLYGQQIHGVVKGLT
jgi:hypothetical protein